ncbi:phosphopantetheine-binding protein [Streptomyces sp. SGAir0957]
MLETTADHVIDLLVRMFRLTPGDVRPDVPLYRLHIDSLELEELRLILEDELSCDLEDVHLTSRSTVQQLLDVVREKAAVA